MKVHGINIKLLPVKIHYFVFMAGLASALPFRTVFAKQLGISATAVGVIFLAVPFLKIITNPLFGFIVDYFKKFRLTIAVFLIIVAITHVAMVFIPPVSLGEAENSAGITLNAKMDYILNQNISKKSESKVRLKLESVFQNSNGKYQEFLCELKCNNVNFLINKAESTQMINKQFCNRSLNLELKTSVELRACEMDIFLASGKLQISDTSMINLRFDKKDSVELSSNSRTYQKNSKCLKTIYNALHLSNYSSPLLKQVNADYAFNHSYDSDLSILLQHMLNASSIEEKSANEREDILQFFKIKEYEINLRSHEKHDENLMKLYPCKDEFECVSTQCISKHPDQGILVEMQRDEFVTVQFWGIFFLMALSSVSFCAVMFLMDTICYEMLYDTNETYGTQRLWGTIGWGLGALAGGYLNQICSPDPSNIDYAPGFYLLALVTILDLVPLYFIEVGNVKYSSNICKDVGLLLSKLDIIINIVIVFMVGIISGLMWNYQFWFMEEIGASQILLGLSQTVECLLAELPCFIVSGWIIRKLGYNHCNSITFLCFGLRYLCFAYMYNPWMTLPLALLHGPTFGLFYASMITYGKSEAPPGTEATVQALLSMAFEGVGAATGSILGGIGIDKFGSRLTFLYTAIACFILLIINVILHATILNQDRRNRMKMKKELTQH